MVRVSTHEYTGIKMEVVEWSPAAKAIEDRVGRRRVSLVAATLRPEIMLVFLTFIFGYELSASTDMAKLIASSAPL
jgi:hypothetical protein